MGDEIDRMDAIAGNANRSEELALRIEMIRRGLAVYRSDRDADALKDVSEAEARVSTLLTQSAEFTLSEQRRALFNGQLEKLHAFASDRARFVALIDAAAAERDRLAALGNTLRSAVVETSDAASKSGGAPDVTTAAVMRAAALSVETTAMRFMVSSDPALADAFNTGVATAEKALVKLNEVASPDVKSHGQAVATTLSLYAASFQKASAATLEAQSLYADHISPAINNMQAIMVKGLDRLMSSFASISQKASDIAESSLTDELALSTAAAVVGITLALLIARSIIRPISHVTIAMTRLAHGDSQSEIPGRDNTDEIGEMARAAEVFRHQAIENERLATAQEQQRSAKERRQNAVDLQINSFGNSISSVLESLMAVSATMRQAASAVAESARQTRESTTTTVDGAAQSSQDLSSVAAAAEEMAASIHEISKQVAQVTTSVRAAVDRATETDTKVASLSEAADRIGDVVRLITAIAGQTNLLALNATIEASRAGEAGRGFAVVAGEVKALAARTSQATSEIGTQIVAIRGATTEAVTAVRDVVAAIGQVELVATTIALAVEEQAAATRQITTSVQQVSMTTSAAASSMRGVLSVVRDTDVSSVTALQASEQVGQTAATLRAEVSSFLSAMSEDETADRQAERVPAAA